MGAIVEAPARIVDRVDNAGELDSDSRRHCFRPIRSSAPDDRRGVISFSWDSAPPPPPRDRFVAAGMIQMYAKAGKMEDAWESFHCAAIKDAVVWSSIITANARTGHYSAALVLVKRMLLEGVLPDAVALTAALAACTAPEAMDQGKLVHGWIRERGFETDLFVVTGLVAMYGKCGSVELAREVFDRSLHRNVVLWTCMIRVYVRHRCFDRALGMFRSMLLDGSKPNKVTFVSLAGGIVERKQCLFVFDLARECRLVSGDIVVITALMGMFSRCREIRSCEKLFQIVPLDGKTLSCWNVMLGAYSEHQKQDQTFQLFRRMLLQGLSPDRVSFLAVLAACSTLHYAKRIQGLIAEAGLDRDLVIGAALVSMYSRCGSLENAFDVFDRFENEADLVFWNSMIGACVDRHPAAGIELFRRMQFQGLRHNEVTLVSVLSACSKCRDLALGKQIHNHLVASGADKYEFLQNALLNLYGICGSIEDACSIFVQAERLTVVSCTAMISALSENGHHAEALVLFRKMLLEGVAPNKITLNTVIGILGKIGSSDTGIEFVFGLDAIEELAPGLITVYGKLHRFGFAAEVFDNAADKREVVLWNSFLAWCDDPTTQYRKMLLEGVPPDKVTYISLLQSFRNPDPEQLLRVVESGIAALGLGVATGLLRGYGQCKKLRRAAEVFDKMLSDRRDDAVAWSSMLSVYADNEQHDEAIEMLRRMQSEGVKPEKSVFVKALNACSASGRFRDGIRVHANVDAAGGNLGSGVGSALVSLYGRLGDLRLAREIFERIPHKDVCSWTALVSAYSEAGQDEAAIEAFRSMQQCGIQADIVSILAVLKSSMNVAELGVDLDSSSSSRRLLTTEMLSLLGKHGRLDEASFIFDRMQDRDSVAWNAIIAVYAQHGHTQKVTEIFRRMQLEGVEADSGTFASITWACSHSGMVKQGCSYFAGMIHEFGVARVEQNYASLVDLLGRAGQLDEAQNAAASCSGVDAGGSMLWKTMLGTCRGSHDVSRGVDAASEVLSGQPRNAEAYVLLSTLLHGSSLYEK